MEKNNTISIKEVLGIIHSGSRDNPPNFSIEWVTLNQQRKTGGEIRSLEFAICLYNKDHKPSLGQSSGQKVSKKRNPNHKKNRTINIIETVSGIEYGKIIKIHPTLITRFNNKIVYLS